MSGTSAVHSRQIIFFTLQQISNGTYLGKLKQDNLTGLGSSREVAFISDYYRKSGDYDPRGALTYVIVVIFVFGFSIVLMIASTVKKTRSNKFDSAVSQYMKGMENVKRKERWLEKAKTREAINKRRGALKTSSLFNSPELSPGMQSQSGQDRFLYQTTIDSGYAPSLEVIANTPFCETIMDDSVFPLPPVGRRAGGGVGGAGVASSGVGPAGSGSYGAALIHARAPAIRTNSAPLMSSSGSLIRRDGRLESLTEEHLSQEGASGGSCSSDGSTRTDNTEPISIPKLSFVRKNRYARDEQAGFV